MKKSIIIISVLIIFSTGFMLGCNSKNNSVTSNAEATIALPTDINHPNVINAVGNIEVVFSPHGGATESIIKAINEAKSDIKIQAYSFTSAPIARALLKAERRGVNVQVILDKSQETEKYSSAKLFSNNKIPLKIDHDFRIAHNKVMIIDNETIITGSFNFTKAAEENNAENLLILRGNKKLAEIYLKNWQWRWDNSLDYNRH